MDQIDNPPTPGFEAPDTGYDPIGEHDDLVEGYVDYFAGVNVPQELEKAQQEGFQNTVFDFASLIERFGQNENEISEIEIPRISAEADVNLEATLADRIDYARETLGLETDESVFFEKVSNMNTFARLAILVDEIKKDPTEWYLYLYLKHTNYHTREFHDDFSIRMHNKNKESTPNAAQMEYSLNGLKNVFDRDPSQTSMPSELAKLKVLRATDEITCVSTSSDVKRTKTIDYEENDDDASAVLNTLNATGLHFVKKEPNPPDFFLSLDGKFLMGNSEEQKYGLSLSSIDGSKNFGTGYLTTVYLRNAKIKNDRRLTYLDAKSIRPYDVDGQKVFALDVTERNGFKTLKGLLNKLRMPYFLKYRDLSKVHLIAICQNQLPWMQNALFFRNLYNSVKQDKLPFNAYNFSKYAQAIPGACLTNFLFGRNINGTNPCDLYCSKYYNRIMKKFVTPETLPRFKPSDGKCMNVIDCTCFVADYQDITALRGIYLGYENDRQTVLGQRNFCTFCGTSYYGENCTNKEHRTRVASRLKNLQSKFKEIEDNIHDPCSDCPLVLRRMNSHTPGIVLMDQNNIVNYECEDPNSLLITALLNHYAGKTIVVDKLTEEYIKPFIEEVACQLKIVDMSDRDSYSKFVCPKNLCGRILEWKRLSKLSDTVLATQMKMQDSDERINNPDALLEALGLVEHCVAKVKQQKIPYLGGAISEEVKAIAKRVANGSAEGTGMKSKKVKNLELRKKRSK